MKRFILTALFIMTQTLFSVQGQAQNMGSVESQFQEVFVIGTYSAAFGLACAAATLPFFVDKPPLPPLRILSGGASLGFIVGSIYALSRAARNPYLEASGEAVTTALLEYKPHSAGLVGLGHLLKVKAWALNFPILNLDFKEKSIWNIDFLRYQF